MGLALGRQKAVVHAGTKNKVAMTDGSREFCTVLEGKRILVSYRTTCFHLQGTSEMLVRKRHH